MAKPWSQVEQSDKFQSLSPQAKIQAKKEYWDKVISSSDKFTALDANIQGKAKNEFFGGRLTSDIPQQEFTPQGGVDFNFRNPLNPTESLPVRLNQQAIVDTVGTVGKSAGNLISNAVQPLIHPIQTGKTLLNTAGGAIQNIPGSPMGMMLKAMPGADVRNQSIQALGQSVKDRYGNADALSNTVINDPAGFLSDVGMAAGATSGALKTAGNMTRSTALKEAGSFPMTAKAGQDLTTAVKESKVYKKAFPAIDVKVNTEINRGIAKAIRPSVSGKSNFNQTAKYYKDSQEAVKTIVENKDILRLSDDAGGVSSRLPQNLNEFLDSVGQVKSHLYNQWDDLLKESGGKGNYVDLNDISKELNSVTKSKILAIKNPSLIEDTRRLQERLSATGKLSVREADDLIQNYNQSLKAFYQNPTYDAASLAARDAMIVNRLRKSLDNVVTNVTGTKYQELKNKYGALKAIEKDIARRAIVDMRKNPRGLIDFTDISSGADIVTGISSMNPALFAKGVAQHSIKEYIKRLNDPNNVVKKMFENVDKLHQPRPTSKIAEFVRTIPVDNTLRLNAPEKIKQLPYKTNIKGLPNLSAEKGGARNVGQTPIIIQNNGVNSPTITPESPNYIDPKLRKAYEEYLKSL